MHAIPITPALARVAHWVLVASAVSGLVGFWSRLSLGLVTVSGLYVLGLFQLTGSVTHDMHLLWFSALLAVSPCGEAASVDRVLSRRRGVPGPVPSARATVPLFFARLLLGLVYFFPGFWKLRESGLAWVASDNLKNQMYWKWYENGTLPVWRIDRHDGLLFAGVLGVVLLELSFPLLVLLPKTRAVAVVGGFLFHALSQLFLFIPFVSLWGCYTMLFDWGNLRLPWRHTEAVPATTPLVSFSPQLWSRETRIAAVLGTALVLLVAFRGAENQTQAWPFACYPTFQWRADPTIPDLVMEAVLTDGTTRVLPDGPGAGGSRTQDEWGTAFRVAGLYGDAPSEPRLRDYLAYARRKPPLDAAVRDTVRVRFYRAWYSVSPEDTGRPPVRAEPIRDIALR